MEEMLMNNDLKIIEERLNKQFKRQANTLYWLDIANNIYAQKFNFFLSSQFNKLPQRSIPLHSIDHYQLDYLEKIINKLKQDTQLTFKYYGFVNLVWPSSQRIIQRQRHGEE